MRQPHHLSYYKLTATSRRCPPWNIMRARDLSFLLLMNELPKKVSVLMTTFNQKDFIAEAIEGVVKQKTAFPVELHIGDDCSSDRTGDICFEYAERFPEIV